MKPHSERFISGRQAPAGSGILPETFPGRGERNGRAREEQGRCQGDSLRAEMARRRTALPAAARAP